VPRPKKGQFSTLGALAEVIAAMAQACDVVAFMTSAMAFAFALTPSAFLLATLAMYLEVNTLYHLAKRNSGAGGHYGYVANAFGPVPFSSPSSHKTILHKRKSFALVFLAS